MNRAPARRSFPAAHHRGASGVHRGCIGVHWKPPSLESCRSSTDRPRCGPSCQDVAAVLPELPALAWSHRQPAQRQPLHAAALGAEPRLERRAAGHPAAGHRAPQRQPVDGADFDAVPRSGRRSGSQVVSGYRRAPPGFRCAGRRAAPALSRRSRCRPGRRASQSQRPSMPPHAAPTARATRRCSRLPAMRSSIRPYGGHQLDADDSAHSTH